MTLIASNTALQEFIESCDGVKLLAVDTEFFRRYSYYPELCLIQINNGKQAVTVDVLAEGLDITPLLDLLYCEDILKIFHSASQDIEIFCKLRDGKVPTPIFDTQIACMACMGEAQTSYERVVKKLLNVTLDKTMQACDWRTRPLSQEQLNYALADVIHLLPLYDRLCDIINGLERMEWLKEEMERIANPDNYQKDLDNLWRNIKGKNLKAKGLAILQNIAKQRELLAMRYDVPRKHIMHDDDLTLLAQKPPANLQKFLAKNCLTMRRLTDDDRQEFYQAIIDGADNKDNIILPQAKILPDTAQQLQIDMLRIVRRLVAVELNITPKLLCEQDDLQYIVMQAGQLPDFLTSGWRYQHFGEIVESFMQGDYQMVIQQGNPVLLKG
ncbi:MAG: HRDC domain-containing protein [Alphaproteobacteria bacterium]|nr:HRDC domain-containing protein [Alphaproteobacteria bacterium]